MLYWLTIKLLLPFHLTKLVYTRWLTSNYWSLIAFLLKKWPCTKNRLFLSWKRVARLKPVCCKLKFLKSLKIRRRRTFAILVVILPCLIRSFPPLTTFSNDHQEKVRYVKFDSMGHHLITGIANLVSMLQNFFFIRRQQSGKIIFRAVFKAAWYNIRG